MLHLYPHPSMEVFTFWLRADLVAICLAVWAPTSVFLEDVRSSGAIGFCLLNQSGVVKHETMKVLGNPRKVAFAKHHSPSLRLSLIKSHCSCCIKDGSIQLVSGLGDSRTAMSTVRPFASLDEWLFPSVKEKEVPFPLTNTTRG